ncbi:MAG TPA: MotA/TolQ/ExbB proton channel family protein, partial [Thermoleophilia bacterium]|nr:MotA/TolQ/ExbB proton channel family protein [Thermoleophilia bacterium]
ADAGRAPATLDELATVCAGCSPPDDAPSPHADEAPSSPADDPRAPSASGATGEPEQLGLF